MQEDLKFTLRRTQVSEQKHKPGTLLVGMLTNEVLLDKTVDEKRRTGTCISVRMT